MKTTAARRAAIAAAASAALLAGGAPAVLATTTPPPPPVITYVIGQAGVLRLMSQGYWCTQIPLPQITRWPRPPLYGCARHVLLR